MRKSGKSVLRLIAMVLVVALMAACASIGHPEGGPRDEAAPVFVRSNPAPASLNYDGRKVEIFFDENIKLDDPSNKVVVSPVPIQQPRATANGRRLVVEFRDSLLPNTTYTIDLGDAVRDLNEGNVLESFAVDFSTGPDRDTLVIAGMVLEARNLEPAQGMLVGVHSNLADTALTTLRFERVAKTDQYGRFVLRNLPAGSYHIFAINDVNRDYKWNRTEDIAFLSDIIVPSAEAIEVSDTLTSSTGADSIVMRPGTRYLPNDVLLTWFNLNYKAQYLKTYTRPDSTRLLFEFGAPSDTLPEFVLLDGPAAGSRLADISVLQYNSRRDSLVYWLKDKRLLSQDTMRLAARYLRTDTLDNLTLTDDTLRIIYKRPTQKKEKKNNNLKIEADSIDTDSITTTPPVPLFELTPASRGKQNLNRPYILDVPVPLDTVAQNRITLRQMIDSVWYDLDTPPLVMDSINNPLRYSLHYPWDENAKYSISVDTLVLRDIYGVYNKPYKVDFDTKPLEDYSTVKLQLVLPAETESPVMVELLSSSDKPVAALPLQSDGSVTFEYVDPNTYYVRAYIDANGNGTWDAGDVAQQIQPEETYYYDKKVVLRKNWDVSQTWQLDMLPVDKQKPVEIVKNKPKAKPGERITSTETDEEEEEDDFYNPGFGNRSNGRGNNNRGNNNRSNNNFGGLPRPQSNGTSRTF